MSKILVIGSGSREHVICDILSKSDKVEKVYVYPGNDGMYNEKIKKVETIENYRESLVNFCDNKIDMVVVGSETELVNGIFDYLSEYNIKCVGPNMECALIEGSKSFSKRFMHEHQIPTANFCIIKKYELLIEYINSKDKVDYVLKYSGLAGGKGVFLSDKKQDMIGFAKDVFINNKFNKKESNSKIEVILEEKLIGQEVSIMGFCNGNDIELMPQSQDYKKIYDGEKGLNTGGMGSHAPVNILTNEELLEVKSHMMKVVRTLNYKGILYAGIIKTSDGISFLEFNCRLGDPEAQVLLNLLDLDKCCLYDIFESCINGTPINVYWKKGYVSNIVLSHEDYPIKKSNKMLKIDINLDELKNQKIYWSNVQKKENEYFTTGGRVMSLVNYSMNFYQSFIELYNKVLNIDYEGKYYRRDIGLNRNYIKDYNLPQKPLKIAILGSTNGTSSQLLIDKINNNEINAKIELIVSNRNDALILKRACENNISNLFLSCRNLTRHDYELKLINILRGFDIDLIIMIGYMRIVTNVFIDEFRGNIINIHPSLLPKYGGLMDMCVYNEVFKNNEQFTGCTLHHVTEEVDKGDIIIQRQLKIDTQCKHTLKKYVQDLESQCIVDAVKIWSSLPINYKQSGVDIDNGNKLVENIKDISKEIGGFCSELSIDINDPHDSYFGTITDNNLILGACCDGVGTKLEIAEKLDNYTTIGIDLVAMSVNDLIASGMRPLYFLDYIAIDDLDITKCEDIIRGINEGCRISGCKLVGGETAEMKGIYRKNKFDLAGFAIGIKEFEIPNKNKIKKGDSIYGLKSSGVHSNGYTLINKLLKRSNYNLNTLLTPTKIYMEIFDIVKKYNGLIQGISHITGGGFKDNITRILPEKVSYKLKSWEFPEVFNWIQRESQMTKEEMLNTYNCGYGMIIITNKIINDEQLDLIGTIY